MCSLFSYCLSAPNPPFHTQHSDTENRTLETTFLFCQPAPHAANKGREKEKLDFSSQHCLSTGPPTPEVALGDSHHFFQHSQKYQQQQ